jgi:hypothetical protein
LFRFTGNLKNLISLNKKAQFDLNGKMYLELPMQELNFLTLTLEKNIEKRATAQLLLHIINSLFNFESCGSPKKPKRKISMELEKEITVTK